jgi:hypothetical protein
MEVYRLNLSSEHTALSLEVNTSNRYHCAWFSLLDVVVMNFPGSRQAGFFLPGFT